MSRGVTHTGPAAALSTVARVPAEAGGDKAAWIVEMFSWLDANDDVGAVIWFEHDKETDWRIRSSDLQTFS